VLAPGSWVVGPWQPNQGQVSYYYVGGTSQATPHVAGVVALMAQLDPGLTASEAEALLESTAVPLGPGSRMVLEPTGEVAQFSWGADAAGSGIVSAPAALAAVSGG
jgi:subtilisin family serine protease